MSKMILSLLVLLLFLAPAQCQYLDDDYVTDRAPRWDLRAGVAFPSGDTVDDLEVIVGAEYEIPIRNSNGYLTFTFDYTAITSQSIVNNIVVEDDVSLFPILMNYKQDSSADGLPVYFGFGVGLYYADDPIPEMRLDDGASFAWQVMAGLEWEGGFFLEGRFIGGSNPSDDGLGIANIGFRF